MEFTMKAECVMSGPDRRTVAELDQLGCKQTPKARTHPFTPEQVMAVNRLYATYIEGKLMATQQRDLADMILEEEDGGTFVPALCGQHLVKARLMLLQWLTSFPAQMDEKTAARTFLSALTDRMPSRYMCFGLYEHHRFRS